MFAVLWGIITHGTFAGTGDEPHYMMIAGSIAIDGDLDLADDYADRDNPIHLGTLAPEAHARPGRDGALRPVHDVGLPALSAPWYAAAHAAAVRLTPHVPETWMRRARLNRWLVLRHLLSFGMMALAAALAVQLHDVFLTMTADRRLAFAGALAAALAPPLLTHSYLFFTELPSALVALTAWRMIGSDRAGPAWHVRLGVIIGFLVLLHARNVGLVAGLAALALLRAAPGKAWVLAGLALPLALRTGVNLAFWGAFVQGPHARAELATGVFGALRESVVRLGGLFFDQEHGLLPYAPVYLLALPGWILLRRAGGPARALAIVVAAYLLPVLCPWVNVHGWRGGWSPAARMLVPIVPFLAIAAFAATGTRLGRVAALLALAQAGILQLLWRDPKLAWNDGDGYAEYADALVPGGAGWLPRFGDGDVAMAAVLLAAWLAVSIVLARERAAAVR